MQAHNQLWCTWRTTATAAARLGCRKVEACQACACALQVDWHYLQKSHKEAWLQLARAAFSSLDTDRDGVLRIDDMVARLAQSLPEAEVRAPSCVHHVWKCVCMCTRGHLVALLNM